MGKFTDLFNNRLKITRKSYERHPFQSTMTAPEWRNVEMADEIAAFTRENRTLFQFPYFRQIIELWKVVFQSYFAARKHSSAAAILTSEYALMDVFIAFFTTMELLPRGLLSLLIAPFLKKENNTTMQTHLADYLERYAADLQTIPFYDHPYKTMQQDLRNHYKQCTDLSLVDRLGWHVISTEFYFRRMISAPLSYWFHQEGNEASPTTEIIVKFSSKKPVEEALEEFKENLGQIDDLALVDNQLYSKENFDHSSNIYALLSAPRYARFQQTLAAMADKEIHLRRIAGQNQVQVKCRMDEDFNPDTIGEKIHFHYDYRDHIHSQFKIGLFDVPVKNLHATVDEINQKNDIKVSFIHNF